MAFSVFGELQGKKMDRQPVWNWNKNIKPETDSNTHSCLCKFTSIVDVCNILIELTKTKNKIGRQQAPYLHFKVQVKPSPTF